MCFVYSPGKVKYISQHTYLPLNLILLIQTARIAPFYYPRLIATDLISMAHVFIYHFNEAVIFLSLLITICHGFLEMGLSLRLFDNFMTLK